MKNNKDEPIRVYRRILEIIWQRLAPTFGERTIAAIARNSIARQAKTFAILTHLSVTDKGLVWTEMEKHLAEIDAKGLSSALEAFLDEFFDALSSLIGRLIIGKMVQEVEEEAKRGDQE